LGLGFLRERQLLPLGLLGNDFEMPGMKHVAVLIETSRAYGRGLLRGIARYNREHGLWSTFFQPQGLGDPAPAWLPSWQGDAKLPTSRNRTRILRCFRAATFLCREA
jgi:hypothetical protein